MYDFLLPKQTFHNLDGRSSVLVQQKNPDIIISNEKKLNHVVRCRGTSVSCGAHICKAATFSLCIQGRWACRSEILAYSVHGKWVICWPQTWIRVYHKLECLNHTTWSFTAIKEASEFCTLKRYHWILHQILSATCFPTQSRIYIFNNTLFTFYIVLCCKLGKKSYHNR